MFKIKVSFSEVGIAVPVLPLPCVIRSPFPPPAEPSPWIPPRLRDLRLQEQRVWRAGATSEEVASPVASFCYKML